MPPSADDATARAEGLFDLIEGNREATRRIVEALVQALPDASEKNRIAIERSLNRWRAENVFGICE